MSTFEITRVNTDQDIDTDKEQSRCSQKKIDYYVELLRSVMVFFSLSRLVGYLKNNLELKIITF